MDKINNLIDAIKHREIQRALELIGRINKKKIKADYYYYDGQTILMLACIHKLTSVVTKLIKSRVDLNATDFEGDTALMHSCMVGFEDGVTQLIEKGADLNCQNQPNKKTALLYACEDKYENIAIKLIEAGCDLNLRNNCGENAVFICVSNSSEDLVIKLFDFDADICFKVLMTNGEYIDFVDYIIHLKLSKVLGHLKFKNRQIIFNLINSNNTKIGQSFDVSIADLNLLDIIVDYLL